MIKYMKIVGESGDCGMYFNQDFSIIELSSRKQDYDISPSVFVPGRVFCSISYRLSGEITVAGKQQMYHITPQSIFYLPCGYDYSTQIIGAGSMYVIHFWVEEGYPAEPFVWKPKDPQLYEQLFSQIISNTKPGQRKNFAVMGQFYQLLAQIRADSQLEDIRIPKRMLEIRSYIHENFNENTMSVAMLAQKAGLSQTYFRREFKTYFGCQPVTYIRNVRVEHAKTLLEAGDITVSEAAIQSGYEGISYFSYDFHRLTGFSPSQYKAACVKRRAEG